MGMAGGFALNSWIILTFFNVFAMYRPIVYLLKGWGVYAPGLMDAGIVVVLIVVMGFVSMIELVGAVALAALVHPPPKGRARSDNDAEIWIAVAATFLTAVQFHFVSLLIARAWFPNDVAPWNVGLIQFGMIPVALILGVLACECLIRLSARVRQRPGGEDSPNAKPPVYDVSVSHVVPERLSLSKVGILETPDEVRWLDVDFDRVAWVDLEAGDRVEVGVHVWIYVAGHRVLYFSHPCEKRWIRVSYHKRSEAVACILYEHSGIVWPERLFIAVVAPPHERVRELRKIARKLKGNWTFTLYRGQLE